MSAPQRREGRRCRGEAGVVGGFESIPFGVLIFVVGMLVVFNAWVVIDAKLAVSAASREGARAAVETVTVRSASAGAAVARARETMGSFGRDDDFYRDTVVAYPDGFVRCGEVIVTSTYEVPALSLPWIGGFGSSITATSSHREIIDPYRSGLEEGGPCLS